ncbi:MAG: hypothetical protein AB7F32_00770 [Victivallaceae bacterium]
MKKELQFMAKMLIPIAIVAALAGCDTVTKYGDDGKIKEKQVSSIMKDDTLIVATNVTGIIVETSVSNSSDNVFPSFKIATGGNTIVKQNKDGEKLALAMTISAGILNSMTSATAKSKTIIIIGAKGDTGDGSAKFVDAVAKLANEPITETASASSSK